MSMDMVTAEHICDLFETCTCATTDSRSVPQGAMFFALRGEHFDGNAYAVAALEEGASYAVVSSDEPLRDRPDLASRMLRVEDTLVALQQTAQCYRRRLAVPIIAIVGSNGKTTTKELVASVLKEKFEICATRGNLNNHIGVPLTLLSMTRSTEFGVVEMGASACGEIATLCAIAEPNYGIITNIGRSHLEGFGGVEGIRRGKGELFDFLASCGGRAFVPEEDATLAAMAQEREGMAAEYYSRTVADGVPSRLTGDYNHYNIAAAVAVGRYFGIEHERIASAIAEYEPTNNRSQEVVTARNRLIVDCYNANPSSMAVAIANIKQTEAQHKILILGDMLELGQWSAEEHIGVVRAALAVEGAELWLVGSEFARAAVADEFDAQAWRISIFASSLAVIDWLKANCPENSLILLKGSHRMALETLVPYL